MNSTKLNVLKTRSFFRVTFSIGTTIVARLLALLTQIIIVRRLSIADYGLYTTIYALLNPIVIFSSFGLDIWILVQRHDRSALNSLIALIFSFRLILTLFLNLLVIPFIWWQYQSLGLEILVFAGISIILEILVTTGDAALRAQLRAGLSALLQITIATTSLFLLWLTYAYPLSLLIIIIFRLISALIGVIWITWIFRKVLVWQWKPRLWFDIVKQARLFFVSELLANITLRGDLTLLALLIGASATAIYNPVLTIINTTFLVPNVASQILLPIVSRQRIRSPLYNTIVLASLLASTVYGLVCFGLMYLQSDWLITTLFGSAYQQSSQFLRLMALIPLLKSFNFCWTMLMMSHDRQLLRTRLQAIGAGTNLLGNIIGIPLFGVIAAATINVITEVVLFISYGYGYWQTIKTVH